MPHQVLREQSAKCGRLSVMMQRGSLKFKSGSAALKMATCRTVTSVLGDRQRAEMLMSSTKCGHRSLTLTIWEIADAVGISRGSAITILTEDLGT
jgi:hypothetical protein